MIYVIEPHPDDAYLSLHEYIKLYKPTIISVFGEDVRLKESAKYATTIGVKHGVAAGKEGLRRFLETLDPDLDVIISPLAIEHPDHETVRKIIEKHFTGYVYYYVDQPYAMKVKNSEKLFKMLFSKKIEWFSRPSSKKWRYSKIYQSQSKLFYYNEDLLKNSFEMVVRE